ncbi:MAG: type I pullulanase [Clostridiales bacterium]|nr:type I pullulanase [Clostridiales bacterium]
MENTTRYDKEFDRRYAYDGCDLGCTCAPARTVFKLWSPEASCVELFLYRDNTGPAYDRRTLTQGDQGVWALTVEGDLHGVYYDYEVTVNSRVARTADPYAMACGCNGARSMAVDLSRTDPEGFGEDCPPPIPPENIIYELHVKDFSHDPGSGVPERYRGKFKAFSWKDADGRPPVCMEHLKGLGVTHVQLLPIYDFASVDEGGDGQQFNWGYDPLNYNVPEGSYATDPDDGAARVRECKEMIQALHANGMRVVMDVVYNHTYHSDSWLERSAPGYYYRRWADGSLSNGSGCGNDIAAGRAMADNYILHSVLYWAREYHIDGFRFDLMGLLTVELMNRIRWALDAAFGPGEKLVYGEPWRAADSPMEPDTAPALKSNIHRLDPGIAVFCDTTRDAVKGDCFHAEQPGFVNGGAGLGETVLCAAAGWMGGEGDFRPRACSQIINYVSAHDNYTLWDKLALCVSEGGGTMPYEEARADLLAQNRLAAFICFTCQGNLFLQAGEEFARTKLGDGNSYKSSPAVNRLDWQRAWRFGTLTDYYRQLIRLRKSLPGLCDKSAAAGDRVAARTVHRDGVVSFQMEGGGPCGERLFIAYNATAHDYAIQLPSGRWTIRADGTDADQHRPLISQGNWLTVQPRSGMLLQS